MGYRLARIALVLSASSSLAAQPPHNAAEARQAIEAASAAFDDSQLHKDRAAMDRLLAADFQFVRGSGRLTDRADFIAGFADPEVSFRPFTITNRIFVPMGLEGGIVGGEGVIEGTDHGQPFREHFRYADTFRWRDGRWQVVYVQVTPIAP